MFKVSGKMFAVLSGESAKMRSVSFKCSDIAFEMLTQREGVIPAPYLARAKWVRLDHLRVMPDSEIKAYLVDAHRLIVEKLPKKLRP